MNTFLETITYFIIGLFIGSIIVAISIRLVKKFKKK
jgi:uncharacterized membrane-anchored protein YhcB (DUF1043 family)